MKQWDYLRIKLPLITHAEESHDDSLRRLGEDGWEMVGIAHFNGWYRAWFKRPKPQQDPYRSPA